MKERESAFQRTFHYIKNYIFLYSQFNVFSKKNVITKHDEGKTKNYNHFILNSIKTRNYISDITYPN